MCTYPTRKIRRRDFVCTYFTTKICHREFVCAYFYVIKHNPRKKCIIYLENHRNIYIFAAQNINSFRIWKSNMI